MDDIFFSVIIPVYNRESCVHLAIASVCQQEHKNWELILIDDGSTDQTESVCRKYAEQDVRIRYFRKCNGGVSSARNLGIQKAQGNFILFLDSDDSMSPSCMRVLQHHISQQITKPDMICFGTCSASKKWQPTPSEAAVYVPREEIRNQYLPTHINLYPQNTHFLLNYIWNKCYSASFLRENSLLFDENRRTWEDGLFVVNCLACAKDLLLIPDALHTGCTSHAVDHLSSKFYPSQISIYLQDEADFKTRFDPEFDFSSEHYCHQNLSTLNTLFSSAFHSSRNEAPALIENALKTPIVHHWVSNIEPQNTYERCLCACVNTNTYKRMTLFYQLHSLKKAILRLIH